MPSATARMPPSGVARRTAPPRTGPVGAPVALGKDRGVEAAQVVPERDTGEHAAAAVVPAQFGGPGRSEGPGTQVGVGRRARDANGLLPGAGGPGEWRSGVSDAGCAGVAAPDEDARGEQRVAHVRGIRSRRGSARAGPRGPRAAPASPRSCRGPGTAAAAPRRASRRPPRGRRARRVGRGTDARRLPRQIREAPQGSPRHMGPGTAARAWALRSGGVRGDRLTTGMPSSWATRSVWPAPPASRPWALPFGV